MLVKKYCSVCNKPAVVASSYRILDMTMKTYTCGHEEVVPDITAQSLNIVSEDGCKPFPYQIIGAKFILDSGARCLVADEMGLGKTIQAHCALKAATKELTPFLIVCKSGLKIQHFREFVRWLDWQCQEITSEDQYILKCKGYMVSMDLLWRFKDLPAFLARLGINMQRGCLLLDEVQAFKNAESRRTKAIRILARECSHIIALSGTPIKNRVSEYFPILNILQPDLFPSPQGFQRRWVESYWENGRMKLGGLKRPEEFKDFTKNFIIRRTRAEVQDEIQLACGDKPFRRFQFVDLCADVEEAYANTVKQFQEYYNSNEDVGSVTRYGNILAFLAKMRHLTGIAKVAPCVEFVEEFILETDRKICIFVHHHDVAELLQRKLQARQHEWPAEFGKDILLLLPGVDRDAIVEQFKGPDHRVMIASTLASGEGLNLQCCADYIMLERQWNPSNEEQAEGRFLRIGQIASAVNGTYIIATGTVDEFLTGIIEEKRSYVSSAIDFIKVNWHESDIVSALAEVLAKQGGKKWGW